MVPRRAITERTLVMDKTQQLHDQPCPKKGPTMLRMVTDALHASGLVPPSRPETGLPPYYNRENISDFYLEKHSGGWVANIVFRHVPPGIGNMLGSPDAHPQLDRLLQGSGTVRNQIRNWRRNLNKKLSGWLGPPAGLPAGRPPGRWTTKNHRKSTKRL